MKIIKWGPGKAHPGSQPDIPGKGSPKCIANGCLRAPPTVGGTIPRQVGLSYRRKVAGCEPEDRFPKVSALPSLDN